MAIEHTLYGRTYRDRDELAQRVAELDAQYDGVKMPQQARDEWNAVNDLVEEFDVRLDRVRQLSTRSANTEAGASFHTPRAATAQDNNLPAEAREARDGALRTIERYRNSGDLRSDAADRLDEVIRRPDPMALDTRYLEAVGSPDYNSAFGKLLADPHSGHLRFNPQEVEAVRRVTAAEEMRGLVEGTGSAGGFAIPFTLDPSILASSSGALNPVRELARVITIGTRDWKGVSSDGVTASYDAEAAEVSDDTPVLAQPQITAAMGRAFVPFSIELGQDWSSLQQELGKLISDGRDVLDATQFLTGTGTDSPAGVLTGLTTTQRVQTAGTAAYAIADVYSLKQALPARFMPRATYATHPTILDVTYRFVGGNSAEPALVNDTRDRILGRPLLEWTTMTTTTTSASKIAIYGDFQAGFTIADRIGMTAEIVPTLFGASRRPTGERGVFAYWRTGSKVVVPNAFRYLEVR
jgi:HK97 family phage major capsid protein